MCNCGTDECGNKRRQGLVPGILLLVMAVCVSVNLWAQKKVKEKKKTVVVTTTTTEGKHYARGKIPVYLGHSTIESGAMGKRNFDSLMKQGLTSVDSFGNVYKVMSFMFTYAEKNLYEDSAGKLQFITDYLAEACDGDTVDANISRVLYDRTKVGDTIYVDQVILQRTDGAGAHGKSMRLDITSR
ncbi:MAG: hypothetical protein H0X33_10150 [Taibaiella sp.]|nr:hypothetical protein [Taibaiella sp.]